MSAEEYQAAPGEAAGAAPDAASRDGQARPARFSDVCGTIDDLKRRLFEEPDAAAVHSDELVSLVEDALAMEERMEQRLREYEGFREEVAAIAASLGEVAGSRREAAMAEAPKLLDLLRRGRVLTEAERAEAADRAEVVRAVASDLERSLYRHKDLALTLARAYRAIKGSRTWVLDEAEARGAAALPGEPEWARWLPPSPHRERILRYLRAGRAHLVAAEGGIPGEPGAPLVHFEDGGLMPLPLVRWSEDVRNFHPADSPPHPRGLLYRGSA